MRYVITRHAQAGANSRSEYPGFDEPLSPLGLRQSSALGARFDGQRFDVLLHSGSVRTEQTAAALIPRVDFGRVVADLRLREGEVGEWVGHRASMRSEIARASGIPLWEVRPPGGESYLDIDARLQPLLADIRSGALGESVLFVGHGRYNTLVVRALLNTPWPDYEPRRMHHTGVTELEVAGDQVKVVTVDDVSHLTPEMVTR